MATFHLFPDLPTELRLLIWEHSFQPRIVTFGNRRRHDNCDDDDSAGPPPPRQVKVQLFHPSPAPAIFHVCSESRSVGEMHYQKTPLCCHSQSRMGQHCNYVWLNFDIDTVQMSDSTVPDPQRPCNYPLRHLIQKLQVLTDEDCMIYFDLYGPKFVNFPALKSVDLIHDGPLDDWYASIAHPEDEYLWGCDPRIVRIIGKDTGEVLDYDRDKELANFDDLSTKCSDTCIHLGPHDWDWAVDDGSWYRNLFRDN